MRTQDTLSKKLFFIALGFLIPMIAARASRCVAGKGYEMLTHEEVPRNPVNASVQWKNALIWAILSGALAGVTRMSSRRLLSGTIIPAKGDDMEDAVEDVS